MNSSTRLHRCRGLLLLLFVCAWPLLADEKPKQDKTGDPPVSLFGSENWIERGAVALIGAGGPLQSATLLPAGEELRLWEFVGPALREEFRTPVGAATIVAGLPGQGALALPLHLHGYGELGCWSLANPYGVRRLDPVLLNVLREEEPLPDAGDDSPAAVFERNLLHEALWKTLRSPENEFQLVARTNFVFDQLEKNSRGYRGQVLQLNGRLRCIRVRPAPASLQPLGVKRLFEVWALLRVGGVEKQVCLLTPQLPLDSPLKPTEDAPSGLDVSLTGYYLRRFQPGADSGIPGRPERVVPLLVGHVSPDFARPVRAALGAGAILGAGSGAMPSVNQLLLLQMGESLCGWTIEDTSRVPSLDRTYLSAVRDRQPLPTLQVSADRGQFPKGWTPRQIEREIDRRHQEAFAYYDAVIKASKTAPALFQRSALPDVNYIHLLNEPQRYRGEPVRIEGNLARVWRFDPMQMVAQAGVKNLYELWLIHEKYGRNTALLITPTLPKGLKPVEQVEGDLPVVFVGYFFKQYAYESEDAKDDKRRIAPLLIGHVFLKKPPALEEDEPPWTRGLLPWFLGLLSGTFVLLFVLTLAFRRADRNVLGSLRMSSGLGDLEAAPPESAPTTEPSAPPSVEKTDAARISEEREGLSPGGHIQ